MSRRKPIAAVILAVQLGITAWLGLLGAKLPLDNRIERFAVKDHQGERDYALFKANFPTRELILVTVTFQDAVDRGAAKSWFAELAELNGVEDVISEFTFAEDGEPPPALPFPFMTPTRATAVLAVPAEDRPQSLVPDLLEWAQAKETQNKRVTRVNVAGEPAVNYHLDQGAAEVKTRFFPVLILVTLGLLGLLFRAVGPLVVTGLSVGSALATTTGIMALMNEPINLITTLVPALVFVLGVAMQVHVLLAVAVQGDLMAGLREKVRPNFLVAATTSIGFASLMTSSVEPIIVMGRAMAIGVWVIFIWTHLTHLGISVLLALKVHPPRLSLLDRLFGHPRYKRLTLVRTALFIPLGIIILGALGLAFNRTESNGLAYFPQDHPIRVSTHELQTHITGASSLELLVHRTGEPPEEGETFFPGEAEIDALESQLKQIPEIRHLFSLWQFSLIAQDSEGDIPEALLEPYISPDYYRVQLLVDSMDRAVYNRVQQQVLEIAEDAGIGASITLTGTLARVIEIQEYLLRSLYSSMGLTILAVIILLQIILGGRGRFLIIFIPNLFPLGSMGLAMPLLGIDTSIATVMVFSIAFGVAVDDTIHLLYTFFQRKGRKNPEARWQHTLNQDARAIFLTTTVLVVGFSVLLTSSFIPTRDFGLLLSIGIAAAWIGDVIFLPMLLLQTKPESFPDSDAD